MGRYTGDESSLEDTEAWRNEARAVFEKAGDAYGLARYWWSVALDRWDRMRVQEAAEERSVRSRISSTPVSGAPD